MNSMNHQGYTARIKYDERDNIFVGRILGIRAIISFHGQTVKELRKEFEHAVDDYLAECSEKGVSPANLPQASSCTSLPRSTRPRHGCRSGIWQEPEPVGGRSA